MSLRDQRNKVLAREWKEAGEQREEATVGPLLRL